MLCQKVIYNHPDICREEFDFSKPVFVFGKTGDLSVFNFNPSRSLIVPAGLP